MGPVELAESTVDGVLGETREAFGDLTDACSYDELTVPLLGVRDQVVEDGDGVGPYCSTKSEAGG